MYINVIKYVFNIIKSINHIPQIGVDKPNTYNTFLTKYLGNVGSYQIFNIIHKKVPTKYLDNSRSITLLCSNISCTRVSSPRRQFQDWIGSPRNKKDYFQGSMVYRNNSIFQSPVLVRHKHQRGSYIKRGWISATHSILSHILPSQISSSPSKSPNV